jgi:hypothetical protein
MQKILFVDKLRDKKLFNTSREVNFISDVFKVSKFFEVKIDEEGETYMDNRGTKIGTQVFQEISTTSRFLLKKALDQQDQGTLNVIKVFSQYQKGGSKNYVATEGLTEVLKRTIGDLKMDYLPENFSAFLYAPGLNYGIAAVLGAFVSIFNNKITIVGFNEKKEKVKRENSHFAWDIVIKKERGKTLKDAFGDFENIVEDNARILIDECDDKDPNARLTIFFLQIVAFISNQGFELQEELNEFSTKRSKRDAEKKLFTSLPYVVVGKDYHGRKFSVDGTAVSGHFRWQPCGTQRSQVKLVFVKPHERVYKK